MRLLSEIVVFSAVVAALGCGRGEESGPGGDGDTLRAEGSEGAEERLEETGRRIGGSVGRTLERTGEAIERAGERVQEEIGPEDTTP